MYYTLMYNLYFSTNKYKKPYSFSVTTWITPIIPLGLRVTWVTCHFTCHVTWESWKSISCDIRAMSDMCFWYLKKRDELWGITHRFRGQKTMRYHAELDSLGEPKDTRKLSKKKAKILDFAFWGLYICNRKTQRHFPILRLIKNHIY